MLGDDVQKFVLDSHKFGNGVQRIRVLDEALLAHFQPVARDVLGYMAHVTHHHIGQAVELTLLLPGFLVTPAAWEASMK